MATSRAKSRRFNINGPRTANGARGAFSTFARRVHLGTNPVAAHPRVSRPIDPDRRVGATRRSDPAGPNRRRAISTSTSTSTDDDPSIDRVRRDRPDADRRVDRPNVVDRPVDRLADRDAARPPPRRRSRPSSASRLGQQRQLVGAPDCFQPTYCFPVTCSARRVAVRGREQHGARGTRATSSTRAVSGARALHRAFLEGFGAARRLAASASLSPSASASSANDLICAAYPSRIARSSGGICGGGWRVRSRRRIVPGPNLTAA